MQVGEATISNSKAISATPPQMTLDSDKILELVSSHILSNSSGTNFSTLLTNISDHIGTKNQACRIWTGSGFSVRRTNSINETIRFRLINYETSEITAATKPQDSIEFNKIFVTEADYPDFYPAFADCYTFKDGEAIKGTFYVEI